MGPGKIRSFLNQPRRWHQGGIKAGETARKTMGDQLRWYGNKFATFNCGSVNRISQIQFTPQPERWFTGIFGVGTLKTIGLEMLSMILGPVYVDAFRQALLCKPLEFKATISREDQQKWYKNLLG